MRRQALLFLFFLSTVSSFSQTVLSNKNAYLHLGLGAAAVHGKTGAYYYEPDIYSYTNYQSSTIEIYLWTVGASLDLSDRVRLGLNMRSNLGLNGSYTDEDSRYEHEMIRNPNPYSWESFGEYGRIKGYTNCSARLAYVLVKNRGLELYGAGVLDYLSFSVDRKGEYSRWKNDGMTSYMEYESIPLNKVSYRSFGAGVAFGVEVPVSRSLKWTIIDLEYKAFASSFFGNAEVVKSNTNRILSCFTSVKLYLHRAK